MASDSFPIQQHQGKAEESLTAEKQKRRIRTRVETLCLEWSDAPHGEISAQQRVRARRIWTSPAGARERFLPAFLISEREWRTPTTDGCTAERSPTRHKASPMGKWLLRTISWICLSLRISPEPTAPVILTATIQRELQKRVQQLMPLVSTWAIRTQADHFAGKPGTDQPQRVS